MLDPSDLDHYSETLSAREEQDLQAQLELFQIFAKLYHQRRDLLDQILELEDMPSKPNVAGVSYVQGVVSPNHIYLVSNLPGNSQYFHSATPAWTLGRDPRQSSVAVCDKRLSRCHAAIQYTPEQGFTITDLESTNGTFVNGERVRRSYALRDGDCVRMGNVTFSFFTCNPVACQIEPSQAVDSLVVSESDASSLQAQELPSGLLDSTLRLLRAGLISSSDIESNLQD